ncbi:hypothetical protein PP740_gp009 [Stenotrophomonas phage Philippe]|uniref:Membrane protein n=1 Tax=Stenotrophomonas phage Philippe TaxID=2859655 RepID=A0AAE7WMI6_9CAUD|nr:hypothetical protein PP740_gp009 [Stenotrophomonas phage Philippe]QYW02208.1 putative membrane protein [Stenotrophomonas phage Philippe]
MGIALTICGAALVLGAAHFNNIPMLCIGGAMIAIATIIEMRNEGYF